MSKPRFETLAIKSAENHFHEANPVSAPIYLSTTYHRNEDGSFNEGFAYSRHSNPNRSILESSIAQLENGSRAFAFATGMAAIHAVFECLKTGDHVIIPDDVYFNVKTLTEHVFKRWGLEVSTVDMSDMSAIENAIQANTSLIWIESPSNPQLKITDIQAVCDLAKKNSALTVVDNTWPTPVLQNPLDLGADMVVHSTTKYFGGHSDVLGGCVVLAGNSDLEEKLHIIQTHSGGVPSPFDCWLICRGIQTLSLRVKAQTSNALELAKYLETCEGIDQVLYPGLPSHPQYTLASSQMKNGAGAMLSVLIKGGVDEAMQVSNNLKYFSRATSLGGVESLVEHRKSIEGPQSPTPQNLLRLSVGLEHVEDLKEDWNQALIVLG